MSRGFNAGRGTRSAWTHLAMLTVIIGGLAMAGGGSGYRLGAAQNALFFTLPAVTAISVAFLDLRSSAVRQAMIIVILVTLSLVAADVMLPPVKDLTSISARWTPKAGLVANANPISMDEVAAIPILIEHVRHPGATPVPGEKAYTGHSPRLRLVLAVRRMAHLFSVVILAGLVLGLRAWTDDHVSFRRPSDERLARFATAWVVAPAALALMTSLGQDVMNRSLFQDTSIWEGLVLMIPFLIIGGLGWWAAVRQVRDSELTR